MYGTDCIYDPNSDHRRKGVYKHNSEDVQARDSTAQTLINAIINSQEHEAYELVREIRDCEDLDDVAARVLAREAGSGGEEYRNGQQDQSNGVSQTPSFEKQVYGKMADLQLDEGSVRYIGGTSHLLLVNDDQETDDPEDYVQQEVNSIFTVPKPCRVES